jgi:V/A-type H+-transporting ATPase subunit I
MILRPAAAQWFELLTSREELGAVLDCLAATGLVQLQAYSRSDSRLALPDLRNTLARYETLARRYGLYWPPPSLRPPERDYHVIEVPRAACAQLEAWAHEADPLIDELETVAREEEETRLLAAFASGNQTGLPRLDLVARAGPVLATRLYVLGPREPAQAMPPSVMSQRSVTEDASFLLVVGPAEQVAELDQAMAARKARSLSLPDELPADPTELSPFLSRQMEALEERGRTARETLERLNESHGIARALGDLALATWVVMHVPELPVTEHFAWVTGWCADANDSRLRAALDERGLNYLLRFLPAPEGETPPTILHNPFWARPFELFAGLMGVPGTREADPSIFVALLAPLMFGYMFGDVAQGAILVLAGLLLQRRLPAMRLLVPGGLVAIAFGFAFGSVFAREDLIPALWLHPLQEPLVVLGAALAFGAVVITLGLVLDAVQHLWRGEGLRWLGSEAGLLLGYLGLLGAVHDVRALWALPVGVAWMILGAAAMTPQAPLAGAGHAAGELMERILQLLVNTISFVRVGAFALAHAGLCAAVVGIAEASGPAYWPMLTLGNIVIVALEGLVVGIQTTRLILFEFFIRFLSAGGRRFEPLPPPTGSSLPSSGRTP